MNFAMQEDPRRRFVFAFTIENVNMRTWLATRSDVLVSLPFNFIEVSKGFLLYMRCKAADICLSNTTILSNSSFD